MQGLNLILRLAWLQTALHSSFGQVDYRVTGLFLAALEVIRRGMWNFYSNKVNKRTKNYPIADIGDGEQLSSRCVTLRLRLTESQRQEEAARAAPRCPALKVTDEIEGRRERGREREQERLRT
ncbi:hypothetical protein GBA52_024229 [Prunus armeniaca]|nr:hypothetical protein GBA52_024229 [Prunus armeniaca]